MRRFATVIMVGVVVAAVALPSSGAVSAAPYRARGNLDFLGPTSVRGAVSLEPVKARGDEVAIGPAPSRGTVALSGAVRPGVAARPCLGLTATGTMTIAWEDGGSSSGPFTLLMSMQRLTLHAKITFGRLKGGQLAIVAFPPSIIPPEFIPPEIMPPGPAGCDANFTGQAMLADPS